MIETLIRIKGYKTVVNQSERTYRVTCRDGRQKLFSIGILKPGESYELNGQPKPVVVVKTELVEEVPAK